MQHLQPVPPLVYNLAIAKFSHTTTPIDHVGPLTWNHVTGNADLQCIFEKFLDSGPLPSGLIQKVVQSNSVLEQVDLVYFVRSATMLARLIPPPKSHFAVVVKSPCIAVKYPYRDTHIRRFQIKFITERDYFMALTLLGEINCPLTEGNPPVPAIRRFPSTSSWPSGNLSTVASRAAHGTSHGNGDRFGVGGIASGGTTPIRASSPASTVSYPLPRFGPLLPAVNQSALTMEPALPERRHGPNPFPETSHSNPEAPNSQLSTVSGIHDLDQLNQMLPPKRDLPFSKPPTKKPATDLASAEERQQDPVVSHSARPSKDSEPIPAIPSTEPDTGFGFPESQSQILSQPAPTPHPSQLFEGPPISSQLPQTAGPAEHTLPVPGVQNTPAHQYLGNSNTISKPDEKGREPAPIAAGAEDQLAEYLAHPTAERLAFLENWMCELIEDEQFMTLCQDVESTWRRFAFGQKQ